MANDDQVIEPEFAQDKGDIKEREKKEENIDNEEEKLDAKEEEIDDKIDHFDENYISESDSEALGVEESDEAVQIGTTEEGNENEDEMVPYEDEVERKNYEIETKENNYEDIKDDEKEKEKDEEEGELEGEKVEEGADEEKKEVKVEEEKNEEEESKKESQSKSSEEFDKERKDETLDNELSEEYEDEMGDKEKETKDEDGDKISGTSEKNGNNSLLDEVEELEYEEQASDGEINHDQFTDPVEVAITFHDEKEPLDISLKGKDKLIKNKFEKKQQSQTDLNNKQEQNLEDEIDKEILKWNGRLVVQDESPQGVDEYGCKYPIEVVTVSDPQIDVTNGGVTTELCPSGEERYHLPEADNEAKINDGRETWGRKAEFILASIGLAVGLGNVWRFPYLCQKNGGGAFLIPYFIMMIIEGIPLFFIEFAVGQRFRRSAVGCWTKIHPALMGIGISCMVISAMLCIYYIAVIAWSFFYLFSSFTSQLPWRIENCPKYAQYEKLLRLCKKNETAANPACTQKDNFAECCVHDPQLYYFYRIALDVSESIEDGGTGMSGKLAGCLILSWILVYLCVLKGVKSSGKAVYFTATFPYVILVILFFVGVTLDGAGIGIKALFKPDFSRLSDPSIWLDAATQMFFTLSLGFGALVSFASYMPIKNNCVRDAYTVVLINCGTSIFAGIVVFSILGHREHVTGIPVTSVGSGPGLAFITFCDAFLQMPVPPLWSALFFIMLILLGIDSEFGTLEGLVAPFYDMKWVTMRKEIFTAILAVIMFFIGLAIISSPGYYAFQLFDDYSVSLPLLFIAFFQTVAISWVYGNDRFSNDIEYMTGKRPFMFWQICWKYISPLAIMIIFIASLVKLLSNTPKYSVYVGCLQQLNPFSHLSGGSKTSLFAAPYPDWGHFVIFVFVTISMVPIVVLLLKHLIQNPQKWKKGFVKTFTNIHEYYPDPSNPDPSRRKNKTEMEAAILKEVENDQYT